jgi:hypothetical protein
MKLEFRRDGLDPAALKNPPQILDRPSRVTELFWMAVSVIAGLLIFFVWLWPTQ